MYNCTFEPETGDNFYFGYKYGVLFDVDPLSELDVDISTEQGYLQTGTVVEAETVEGVSREITGVFLDYSDMDLVQAMLSTFVPGMHGKLYFNDNYYCECVVEKTPALSLKDRKRTFSLMLYCPYPYWISVEDNTNQIGGYVAAFQFPVCYDTHTFGVWSGTEYIYCENAGNVSRPIKVEFYALSEVNNYGIQAVDSDEYLQVNDTLQYNEVVTVYWDSGRLKVEKTADGEVTDIFSLLDEGSTLFTLPAGETLIKAYADDDGEEQMKVVITLAPATAGVVADD